MPKVYKDQKVSLDENLDEYVQRLQADHSQYRILKKAVDARGRKTPHWVVTLEIFGPDEIPTQPQFQESKLSSKHRPIIVGTGPAGLFAALRLAERGVPCDLFERGSICAKRIVAINRFWRYNEFNPDDNVCFGEGGAGMYSDGKLITRIKSPHIPYIMNRLVSFGAPREIEYMSNPHVGSDKIRRLLPTIRKRLQDLGCEFYFNSKVTELLQKNNQVHGVRIQSGKEFHSPFVVLATGHSAKDIFSHLSDIGVHMEGKSFALGLRIEHPQGWVNQQQYREAAGHPDLGAANYKLTHHNPKSKVGVYSFCMCPGGYVLSAGTDPESIVCNGMSNYSRSSPFASSAVVVSIDHNKTFGADNVFGGMEYRANLEHEAWKMVQESNGQQQLPAQYISDFLEGKTRETIRKGSSPSGTKSVRLDQLFSDSIYHSMIQAFEKFQHKMPGFIHPEAVVYGVESRTSCPIRITRDGDTFQSTSHPGLYPCGEGAGFAGGITSAGCDGIRVADAIGVLINSQKNA